MEEATAEVHAHPLCLKCNVRVPASEMEAHSKRCRFSPSPFDMAAAAQSRKLKTVEHARREIVTTTPLQSTSLDRLSYFFDSKGTLRHRKTRRTAKQEIQFQPANNVLYSDLVDAVIEAVQHRMITKMGFSKILVPAESTALHPQARAPIFCSHDWAIASNLLVVIQSSGGVRPGIWSRSLCFEHGLESGSMIPIIHRAQKLKRPMGIIVINPNENVVRVQDTTSFAVKQKKIKVAFSETPSRHLVYVWDHYIQKARAKSIFVLAHGQGGSLVQHLFEKRSSARRGITAVALTDSTHIAHGPNAEGNAAHVNATMRAKAINWYLLPASSESSPAITSGTPTPPARSIFRFFAWASDEGRMITGCSTFADEETRASIRDDPCAPSPPPILLEPSRVSPVEVIEDQEELLRTMVLPKSPPSPQRKRRSSLDNSTGRRIRACIECASPQILWVQPLPTRGGKILVKGANFGHQITRLRASIGTEEVQITAMPQYETRLVILIPDSSSILAMRGAIEGGIRLRISLDGAREALSSPLQFDAPYFDGQPVVAAPTNGGVIELTGDNFGADEASISLHVDGTESSVVQLTNPHSSVRFMAPPGTGSTATIIMHVSFGGNRHIKSQVGETRLSYLPPIIHSTIATRITESEGGGALLVVNGENFGCSPDLVSARVGAENRLGNIRFIEPHKKFTCRLSAEVCRIIGGGGSNRFPLEVSVDGQVVRSSFKISRGRLSSVNLGSQGSMETGERLELDPKLEPVPQPEIEQKQEFQQERESEREAEVESKRESERELEAKRELESERESEAKQEPELEPEQEQEQQEPKSDHEEEAKSEDFHPIETPNRKREEGGLRGAAESIQSPTMLQQIEWQDSMSCMCCDRAFNFLTRKHHCRFCGACVCHTCSRVQLPAHDEDAAPNTQSNMEHTKTEESSEKTAEKQKMRRACIECYDRTMMMVEKLQSMQSQIRALNGERARACALSIQAEADCSKQAVLFEASMDDGRSFDAMKEQATAYKSALQWWESECARAEAAFAERLAQARTLRLPVASLLGEAPAVAAKDPARSEGQDFMQTIAAHPVMRQSGLFSPSPVDAGKERIRTVRGSMGGQPERWHLMTDGHAESIVREVPLENGNGGAAWKRLLWQIAVQMRLGQQVPRGMLPPCFAPILAVSVQENHHGIIMALVEMPPTIAVPNPTLAEWVGTEGGGASARESRRSKPWELQSIMQQLFQGVALLHAGGFVHTNLSLDSIRLVESHDDGGASRLTPMICDLSQVCTIEQPKEPPTVDLTLKEVSDCMAPEIVQGHAHATTTAADMWSLGGILFKSVFGVDSDVVALDGVRVSVPVVPLHASLRSEYSSWWQRLRDLLSQLLVVNPDDRLASAQAALWHPCFSVSIAADIHEQGNFFTGDEKLQYFRVHLEELRLQNGGERNHDDLWLLRVNRATLVRDALLQFSSVRGSSKLLQPLHIAYEGEAGIDAGGLKKDMFSSLFESIFDNEHGLFERGQGSFFLPVTAQNVLDLELFRGIGVALLKAMIDGVALPLRFAPSLYRYLLHRPPRLQDLEAFDPDMASQLRRNVLAVDLTGDFGRRLGLDFAGLKHDGHLIPLREHNKGEFVRLTAQSILETRRANALKAIRDGFETLALEEHLSRLNDTDLQILLSGASTISADDVLASIDLSFGSWPRSSKTLQHLCDYIYSLDSSMLKRLVRFLTGSPILPSGGLGDGHPTESKIRFQCKKDTTRLPEAHTCFNLCDLPDYRHEGKLRKMMNLAICGVEQAISLE
eukprot:g5061.t1